MPLNPRALRHLTRTLLNDLLHVDEFDLALYLVGEARMREVNEQYLQHHGATDVITFDYTERAPPETFQGTGFRNPELHGEIFICVPEAVRQAKQFRTSLENEIVRYLIHGLLHLRGFDDHESNARRRMKREEDRLLKQIRSVFPIRKVLARPATRRTRVIP